jgi:hypothetical protein
MVWVRERPPLVGEVSRYWQYRKMNNKIQCLVLRNCPFKISGHNAFITFSMRATYPCRPTFPDFIVIKSTTWAEHLMKLPTTQGSQSFCPFLFLRQLSSVLWPRTVSVYVLPKLHGLSPRANYTGRAIDRRLSAKWLPTFANKGCHVVSVTDPYGHILGSRQEPLLFYQVAPQLYSRGWVNPVPDTVLFFCSAGNRTQASGSVAKNSDHQTTEAVIHIKHQITLNTER